MLLQMVKEKCILQEQVLKDHGLHFIPTKLLNCSAQKALTLTEYITQQSTQTGEQTLTQSLMTQTTDHIMARRLAQPLQQARPMTALWHSLKTHSISMATHLSAGQQKKAQPKLNSLQELTEHLLQSTTTSLQLKATQSRSMLFGKQTHILGRFGITTKQKLLKHLSLNMANHMPTSQSSKTCHSMIEQVTSWLASLDTQ